MIVEPTLIVRVKCGRMNLSGLFNCNLLLFLVDQTDGSTSPGSVSPALLKSALVTHQRSQSLSGLQVTGILLSALLSLSLSLARWALPSQLYYLLFFYCVCTPGSANDKREHCRK